MVSNSSYALICLMTEERLRSALYSFQYVSKTFSVPRLTLPMHEFHTLVFYFETVGEGEAQCGWHQFNTVFCFFS